MQTVDILHAGPADFAKSYVVAYKIDTDSPSPVTNTPGTNKSRYFTQFIRLSDMATELLHPPSLYTTMVLSIQQFHDSLHLPGPNTLISKVALSLMYLALLTVLPNAFGWTLALVCIVSPSLRMFLFESWAIDGNLQFNSFCWQLQFVVNLLVGSVYGGLSFVLWPFSSLLGLYVKTVWVCLGIALPIYGTVHFLFVAYDTGVYGPLLRNGMFPAVVYWVHTASYDQGARSQTFPYQERVSSTLKR